METKRCSRCPCIVLKTKNATKQDIEEKPDLFKNNEFYTLDDMMKFENIGFSHTADGFKFLVCADCESLLGWCKEGVKEYHIDSNSLINI